MSHKVPAELSPSELLKVMEMAHELHHEIVNQQFGEHPELKVQTTLHYEFGFDMAMYSFRRFLTNLAERKEPLDCSVDLLARAFMFCYGQQLVIGQNQGLLFSQN